MASEIRVNSLSSRTGLSTVTFTDTGPIFSGITTFQDNSGFNVGTGGSIFSPASNTVTLGTNNAERLRITSTGQMGLGTNTPVQQSGKGLHIHNSGGQTRIKLTNNITGDTANDGFDIIQEHNNDVHILNHENGILKIGTNDAERMRITSAGDVQARRARSNTAGDVALSIQPSDSTIHYGFRIDSSNNNLNLDRVGTGNFVSITAVGNIGVGVANPSQKFMVKGIIASEATNSTNNWMAYTHTDDTFRLNYNGAGDDEVVVTSGGNISVGGAAGRDFSLLDGIVTNTANGSAGLLINSSSSSHNAYLGFSYGSGSSTSHADQFSAYIGRVGDNTLILGTDNNIRARVTSGGDVLIGGQTAYTYDDTGSTNTILDIANSNNNKRGILSLSGNCNANGPSIGTIWFNNDQNSGTGPGGTMKLVAAIQAKAVTSDSNAGDDSGAYLQFLTKPESAALAESMVIHSDGEVTKPRQPSFRAGRNSNYSPGAGNDIVFNTVSGGGKHNVGNHYNTSNGRFTAPVAGVYTFTAHVIWQDLSSGQNMADCFHPRINGTVVGYSGRRGEYISNTTGNGGYYTDFMTYQFTLAAGDFVTIENQFNLTVHGNSNYTTFSGHLVC
jgi:hypothetical protein